MAHKIEKAIKFNGAYLAVGDVVKVRTGVIPEPFDRKGMSYETFYARVAEVGDEYIELDFSRRFYSDGITLPYSSILRMEVQKEVDIEGGN